MAEKKTKATYVCLVISRTIAAAHVRMFPCVRLTPANRAARSVLHTRTLVFHGLKPPPPPYRHPIPTRHSDATFPGCVARWLWMRHAHCLTKRKVPGQHRPRLPVRLRHRGNSDNASTRGDS